MFSKFSVAQITDLEKSFDTFLEIERTMFVSDLKEDFYAFVANRVEHCYQMFVFRVSMHRAGFEHLRHGRMEWYGF